MKIERKDVPPIPSGLTPVIDKYDGHLKYDDDLHRWRVNPDGSLRRYLHYHPPGHDVWKSGSKFAPWDKIWEEGRQ